MKIGMMLWKNLESLQNFMVVIVLLKENFIGKNGKMKKKMKEVEFINIDIRFGHVQV